MHACTGREGCVLLDYISAYNNIVIVVSLSSKRRKMSENAAKNCPAMKFLTSDLDYYAKAYRAYAGFSEKKLALYEKWADETFAPVAVEVLQRQFKHAESLKVLGIGSGSGEVDVCLLEKLSSKFPRIINTVIEPSPDALAKYASLVEQKETKLPGVTCHFLATTLDDFFEGEDRERSDDDGAEINESRQKFHLIHAVQSLYYAANIKDSISRLYESLEDGGVMLIILQSNEHLLHRMWARFPFINDMAQSGQAVKMSNTSGQDVTRILQELGLTHSTGTVAWRTDKSHCFDPESPEGNAALDFITHTVQFRSTAPRALQEDVLSFFKSECLPGGVDEKAEGGGGGTEQGKREGGHGEVRKHFIIRDWQYCFVFKS